MKSWKQAFWLAKFELTASPLHLLALYILGPLFILFLTLTIFSLSFDNYLDTNYVGFDMIFIFLLTLVPAWLRPKGSQIQQVNSDHELWAAPTLVMHLQLAIPKEILIKSRFVIYFFYSFPLQCIFLFSIYIMTPNLQSMISPSDYLVFCIIWLSFAIYIGFIMPAGDVGDRINLKTVTLSFIGIVFGTIAFLTSFILMTRHGLVYSTIIVAQKWPILSIIGSLGLAILGILYWQYYMKKSINKTDYL